MFEKNYLKELPEDCVRVIYKHLYDFSVNRIKHRIENNEENSKHLSLLKKCLKVKEENEGFPYNQVAYIGKITDSYWQDRKKYSFIYNEWCKMERVDRMKMNLCCMKTVFVEELNIKYARIKSKALLDLYKKNKKVHKWISDRLKGYYDFEWDRSFIIKAFVYKIYIDKGNIVFGFNFTPACCMAEFLMLFNNMFIRMVDEINDLYYTLQGAYRRMFDADIWRERMERGIFPDMKREPFMRAVLKGYEELMNLDIDNCDIKVRGDNAIITNVFNFPYFDDERDD